VANLIYVLIYFNVFFVFVSHICVNPILFKHSCFNIVTQKSPASGKILPEAGLIGLILSIADICANLIFDLH